MFTFTPPEPVTGDHLSPSATTRIFTLLSSKTEHEGGEHARPEEPKSVSDDTLSIFDAPVRELDTDEFGICEHMGRWTPRRSAVAVSAAAVLLVGGIAVAAFCGPSITVQETEETSVVQTAVYDEEDDVTTEAVADATNTTEEETVEEEVVEEEVVVDASDDTVYLVVGEDIEAGTWRLSASSSSDNLKAYFAVYTDEEETELLANDSFSGVSYITVTDGQYLRVSRAKLTAVTDETAPASNSDDESAYLVGVDMDADSYTLTKTVDDAYASYVLWSSTDAATRTIVASGDFEETLKLTVSEGQVLTLTGATFESVDTGATTVTADAA